MRMLLIVNPVAGTRRARGALMDIAEVFSRGDVDLTVKVTGKRGDATSYAASARAEEYDRVICVGGDGTLNETASGLIEGGQGIPLGYIPLGSTNDFGTTMGLSRDPVIAAKTAMTEEPWLLDMGQFGEDRRFAYIASFGVFTELSYSVPQLSKNILGRFAYFPDGIRQLLEMKTYHLSVTADGEEHEGDYIFGAIMNTRSIAGILKLDEDKVDLSDGLFEVALVRAMKNPADLNRFVSSLISGEFDPRVIEFFHAAQIRVRAKESITWTLDGEEAAGGTEIEIRNLHNALGFASQKGIAPEALSI